MSDPEKPKFQAGATIQIQLDQVQLIDPEAPPEADAGVPRRTAPPPLPATAMPDATAMPEVMASAATPAPPRSAALALAAQRKAAQKDSKLALHLGVVIGVVVLAVIAGLVVAWRVRAGSAAVAGSASPSGAEAPSASALPASSAVLTIPPIEVR
jgi:hypothetical protein